MTIYASGFSESTSADALYATEFVIRGRRDEGSRGKRRGTECLVHVASMSGFSLLWGEGKRAADVRSVRIGGRKRKGEVQHRRVWGCDAE